ncbi:MAG: ABC transporter substrate-binding protein [Planctomycetes bacterium]|nr:ABC transporter substrate-binding protein [Planctomycetota bacterium]
MRLVSLCPSLTELVFDLGRGADLVGVTDWCVHPKEGVARVEKVGGTKNPKVARIVELRPDLVLMNDEENRRADADALIAAGVEILSSLPRDCAGTAAMVRSIGAALDRAREAEAIALDIEARSARVRAAAQERVPVRFAYLIWRKPWMAASADTFASSLLEQAGGVNVFATSSVRYPEITPDELARAAPERVFLCTEPFPFEAKHAEELALLTGLPRERFVIADGEYLSWHGSRTPAGIDYAASLVG